MSDWVRRGCLVVVVVVLALTCGGCTGWLWLMGDYAQHVIDRGAASGM